MEGKEQDLYLQEYDRIEHNPRIFTSKQKEECWNKATKMIGRDPDRWRLDAVGNPVLKGLRGCTGPLCHDYDHIIPYSKGGLTEIANCQILQSTVNKFKSNKTNLSQQDMKIASSKIVFTNSEFDAIEKAVYGNVKKQEDQLIQQTIIKK